MSTTSSSSTSPSSLPRHTFSWFLLILANTLWATSYVAGKFVLQDLSVNMLNALRMCLASLLLIPFLLFKRKEIHLTWHDIPQLLLLALTGFMINKVLEFGTALAVVLLHEQLTPITVLGGVLIVMSVFLLSRQ